MKIFLVVLTKTELEIIIEREERQHNQIIWFTSQCLCTSKRFFTRITKRSQLLQHTSQRLPCLTQEDLHSHSFTNFLNVFTL